jgi:hypothetical protein
MMSRAAFAPKDFDAVDSMFILGAPTMLLACDTVMTPRDAVDADATTLTLLPYATKHW